MTGDDSEYNNKYDCQKYRRSDNDPSSDGNELANIWFTDSDKVERGSFRDIAGE